MTRRKPEVGVADGARWRRGPFASARALVLLLPFSWLAALPAFLTLPATVALADPARLAPALAAPPVEDLRDLRRRGHGEVARLRPLATRLSEADRVVFGTIVEIGTGRIRVDDVREIGGAPAPAFLLKRAPSRAPDLVEGERRLLLLRGARSPYLLVDRPGEALVVNEPGKEARFDRAVRALLSDGPRLGLYEQWLDGDDPNLAAQASRHIALPEFGALPDDFFPRRVAVAIDVTRAPALRNSSASLAALDRRGAEALLAEMPGGALGAPEILRVALGSGQRLAPEAGRAALVRSLRDPSPEIRGVGLRMVGPWNGAPDVAEALAAIARDDPDSRLREAAHRHLRRRTPSAPMRSSSLLGPLESTDAERTDAPEAVGPFRSSVGAGHFWHS